MVLIALILMLAGLAAPGANLWRRLPKPQAAALRRWFGLWAIKGLAAPFFIWLVFNTCFSESFPPLMIQIQAAPAGAATVGVYLAVAGIGFFFIGTFWAAVTLGWWLLALEAQAEDRRQFKETVLVWSVFLVPLAVVIVWGLGVGCAGVAGIIWLSPIVYAAIPQVFREKTAPTYSRAAIKMMGGKYQEAESAVIEELEKSEDDSKGWLMLAELYAHHFDDLAGADRIVHETCAHPNTSVSEVCLAFNHLADWHLSLADDPVAARAALEEICGRFPETHMARMARQRIQQLPASREEWIARRAPKKIRLPALGQTLDQSGGGAASLSERKDAAALANQCVEKLKKNPDDMAVREELARILAERLGKAGGAIEQLELLLNMPEASAGQAAQWLGLVAAWQIKYLGDVQKGRETMEKLIRLYPQSAEAFAAQRRLSLMDLEAKFRAARAAAGAAPEKPISLSISS